MKIFALTEWGYEGTDRAYFGVSAMAIVKQMIADAKEEIDELRELNNDRADLDLPESEWMTSKINQLEDFIELAEVDTDGSSIDYHPEYKEYSFEEIEVLE